MPDTGTGPVKNPFATTVTGLLEVGPGAKPPTPPDLAQGKVVGVWGYVGLAAAAPTQTSQPPISCGVFGEVDFTQGQADEAAYVGYAGLVGESGFSGTMTDPDANGDGVLGFGGGNGVRGFSTGGTGVAGTSTNGSGVTGTSTSGSGVEGSATDANAYGVLGTNTNGIGIRGQTIDGLAAIVGQSTGKGLAGAFYGNVAINGNVTTVNTVTAQTLAGQGGNLAVQGNINVSGTLTAQVDVVLGSDCAEDFDVVTSAEIVPGTVMVLTDNGALQPSQTAYDSKVAGVISGAGEYRPGLILGRSESSQERMPLALAGKVFCKVDADPAPIAVGDLLTTSPRPGFGMKATDPARAFGAVIGKALRPLPAGQGMIPILIALQ